MSNEPEPTAHQDSAEDSGDSTGSGIARMWREFRERKVIRVAVLYVVVGWGVIVGSADLTQILELPSWFPKATFGLVLLGFPVALVLAWAFELTSQGIRRASSAGGPPTVRASRRSLLAALMVGTLAVAAPLLLAAHDARRTGGTERAR